MLCPFWLTMLDSSPIVLSMFNHHSMCVAEWLEGSLCNRKVDISVLANNSELFVFLGVV